ncbi:MAG: hypothetical protein P4L66_12075 [Acetobacteraceae bacterium]|nr:hypothetical protein [Acetobacteraceae bacterium]
MNIHAWTRRAAVCACLVTPLILAACSSDEAARNYPKPNYSYLTKLHLNVANIEIDDRTPPARDNRDMAILAPNKPADVLRTMARDRLLGDGSSGQAVFKVDEASIVPDHDKLKGSLAVQLEVATSDGSKTGYAEARVSRTIDYDNDAPNATRATLDQLVNQMMTDMNVEFEFQVRKSLHAYMQTTPTSAAPAPVVAQPVQSETLAPFLTPTPIPPKP